MCELADALIAPVRYGVARPTTPFVSLNSIQDAINCSEELFLVDPLLNNNSSPSLDHVSFDRQSINLSNNRGNLNYLVQNFLKNTNKFFFLNSK